ETVLGVPRWGQTDIRRSLQDGAYHCGSRRRLRGHGSPSRCACFAMEWIWSEVKTTGDPARSRDRPANAGVLASLPRRASPRLLVIRTRSVSPAKEPLPIRNVSFT